MGCGRIASPRPQRDRQADERAAEGPHEHHERERPPAEHRSDDGQQLAVAQTQPFALEHVVVEIGDDPEKEIAGGGADQAFEPARPVRAEARQEQDRNGGQGDDIRKQLGGEIDERQHQQHAGKGEIQGEARESDAAGFGRIGGHEFPPDRRRQQRRAELDHRMARGERRPAGPTAAPKEEVRKDRDVVGGANRRPAAFATRAGPHHRFAARDAVDADVEEASPQGAEHPGQSGSEGRRKERRAVSLTHRRSMLRLAAP